MKATPSVADRLQFLALGPRDWIVRIICVHYKTFLWGFSLMSPVLMEWSSRLRARRAMYRAAKLVPAYGKYLSNCSADQAVAPETDKENYIKAYPAEARCCHGAIPLSAHCH